MFSLTGAEGVGEEGRDVLVDDRRCLTARPEDLSGAEL